MIAQEEIKKPLLSRKQIRFWFERMRKLDLTKLEHRKRLIDTFVNAVVLYDDRIKFIFNYKDDAKTVTFQELEESSDLFASARPKACEINDFTGFFHAISLFTVVQILKVLILRRRIDMLIECDSFFDFLVYISPIQTQLQIMQSLIKS